MLFYLHYQTSAYAYIFHLHYFIRQLWLITSRRLAQIIEIDVQWTKCLLGEMCVCVCVCVSELKKYIPVICFRHDT